MCPVHARAMRAQPRLGCAGRPGEIKFPQILSTAAPRSPARPTNWGGLGSIAHGTGGLFSEVRMLDDHDNLLELRRQLQAVCRRVDETVALLGDSRGGLTADGLESVAVETWTLGRGDLFQLCVRLEVA